MISWKFEEAATDSLDPHEVLDAAIGEKSPEIQDWPPSLQPLKLRLRTVGRTGHDPTRTVGFLCRPLKTASPRPPPEKILGFSKLIESTGLVSAKSLVKR